MQQEVGQWRDTMPDWHHHCQVIWAPSLGKNGSGRGSSPGPGCGGGGQVAPSGRPQEVVCKAGVVVLPHLGHGH